jgi:poly(3-hydroxyalkanoate) synthetase
MERPDAPAPHHRRGPRPLILHLMLATLPSSAWPAAWQNWSAGWQGSAAPPQNPEPPNLPLPDAALLAGIAAYRRHPYQRVVADPPSVWTEGGSTLLDYGPPGASPVLFVPSLVNRAYVLDLQQNHSMMRFLSAHGVRPLLLDWGFPGEAECDFTLTDYVAGRLLRAIASVGQPVTLAGYCMGGLMAVAAAQLRPDLISRLALLATPWDFWAADGAARRLADFVPVLEPAFALAGAMPVDALQMLFSLLDPGSVGAKYRDFGRQDQSSARALMFVALEDWLNDGVPLAAPVAREVLGGWYGRNTPGNGCWRIAGLPVAPEALRLPCLLAIPSRDRLVPPESAEKLASRLVEAATIRPQAGHIGMVAGSNARGELWQPLLDWLASAA